MKKLIAATGLILLCSTATNTMANSKPEFNIQGYFGSINNASGYIIECSQVIGGYCANNPMPADGYIQMLPDPGSNSISGKIMVIDPKNPNGYKDTLPFKYTMVKGQFTFTVKSVMKNVKVKNISSDTIVLEPAEGK